jgi:hypothetical protein
MAYLTATKRTASLTGLQLDAWFATLGVFPAEVVNTAVLEMALTDTRFPELGDLYQICRTKAIKAGLLPDPYIPTGDGKPKLTLAEIRTIGERFQLRVL